MGKYFGTDGIRGVVNAGLDAGLAYKVGVAAAMVLSENKHGKPMIAIGKDTRISGDMLEAALVAGLCSAGADVLMLGVVPTPAVAFITRDSGADAGIVISASHNPFEHNGIKIFNEKGFKLSDQLEANIEELIDNPERMVVKTHGEIGKMIHRGQEFVDRYVDYVVSKAECEIRPIRVLMDCSNGAAARTAEAIFSRFPIQLELIKDHPDGININDGCGSTHLETLCKLVVAGEYDLGLAFDGDADRCLAVDECGNVVDGDKIMGICGLYMRARGMLDKDTIVATVMSNLGFHEFATKNRLHLECTAVGDRNVLECMLKNGYKLGGEQSGHLIFLNDSTTGDGQLAAVKLLSVLSAQGKKISELVQDIPSYPQILINVPISGGNAVKDKLMSDEEIRSACADKDKELGDRGRVLVRASGTEALIRVMVEADEEEKAREVACYLSEMIKNKDNSLKS
jgi:phosphoglucosamine mutase